MEMTYVDLLKKLEEDVESDVIPFKEKSKILHLIRQLQTFLWKYSA